MTFDTPDPITATIDVPVGAVRITGGERAATVVDVRPGDEAVADDVQAAEQTRVEYADGKLTVTAPRSRAWSRGLGGAVEVTVELPAGSIVHGAGQAADFHAAGRLGYCRIKTAIGRIRLDEADTVHLRTETGDISVERATGHVDVKSGSGDVRLGELGTTGVVKNANGDTWVGIAGGDVRLSAANGSIAVDHAGASVVAKTASGDVRLGGIARGEALLETRIGDVDVGIPDGVAAYLDVRATAGRVANALEPSDAPGGGETVEVRARTDVGDVVIRRS